MVYQLFIMGRLNFVINPVYIIYKICILGKLVGTLESTGTCDNATVGKADPSSGGCRRPYFQKTEHLQWKIKE